jgi:hypothetical protein
MQAEHPKGVSSTDRPGRRVLAGTGAALAFVVVLLGYWSNSCSLGSCSIATARWMSLPFRGSQVVYCLEWPAPIDPSQVLGPRTTVRRHLTPGQAVEGTPVLNLGSPRGRVPFVVCLNWSWSTGKLRGAGGKCIYLCFFSYIIWENRSTDWQL